MVVPASTSRPAPSPSVAADRSARRSASLMASTSAWSRPGPAWKPSPMIRSPRTITAPTSGLGLVRPWPFSARAMRPFEEDRVLFAQRPTKKPLSPRPRGREGARTAPVFSLPDFHCRPRNPTWSASCGSRAITAGRESHPTPKTTYPCTSNVHERIYHSKARTVIRTLRALRASAAGSAAPNTADPATIQLAPASHDLPDVVAG